MLTPLVAAVVLLGVVKSPVVDACSPPVGWRPMSTSELIQRASNVLFVRARHTFPEYASLYTAEVDVYCVLKGSRTPPVLNITGVGFAPGMCIATSLTVGNTSLVLANVFDGVYRVSRTYAAGWPQLSEYAQICGLQKLYPTGVEEASASWTCPTPAPPGECEDAEDSDSSDESPTDD